MLVLTFTILPFGVLVLLLFDPSLIPSSILHRPFIDPFIDPSSTLHRPKITPRAKKGVLHYVLRRKRVILRTNDNFALDKCVKARGGRTALQPQALLSLK